MRLLITFLSISLLITFSDTLRAQEMNPDKFMNKLLKDDHSLGVKVPGWLIKFAGKTATNDLEKEEQEMIRELTSHIKKLRLLVNTKAPADFSTHYTKLINYFHSHNYEPLVEARDKEHKISLWADMDGDIIHNLVITILNEEETSTVFNIKSDLDMQTLKDMNFFKRLQDL